MQYHNLYIVLADQTKSYKKITHFFHSLWTGASCLSYL